MKACNQCGKCCINYSDGGLAVTSQELEMWEIFRPDISAYVRGGEIWFSPTTGKRLTLCPFLRKEQSAAPASKEGPAKYTCDIYHDRPNDCKHYPVRISDMVNDECEMLEQKDLSDTRRAQNQLQKIMLDSWSS